MLVHFVNSPRNNPDDIQKEYQYFRKIMEVVNTQGGVFTRNWTAAAYNEDGTVKPEFQNWDKLNWQEVFGENMSALRRADVVIIEASTYTFHQGFYASQAIQQKKPTLMLYRDLAPNHPLEGIQGRWLTSKRYSNLEELEKITKKFLKDNTVSAKDLRFNFFIDRQIYSYLRQTAYETGKNKSEIVREILEEEIDQQERQ